MRLLILLALACLTGCSTEVIRQTNCLSRPDRPLLARSTSSDLECLTDESYARLVDRDLSLTEYAEKLEVIIDQTCEDKNNGLLK